MKKKIEKPVRPERDHIACDNCGMPYTRFRLNLILLAHGCKVKGPFERVCDECFQAIPKVKA